MFFLHYNAKFLNTILRNATRFKKKLTLKNKSYYFHKIRTNWSLFNYTEILDENNQSLTVII